MPVDLQDTESQPKLSEPHQKGGRRWVRITLGIMVIALAGWYFLGDVQKNDGPSDNESLPAGDSASAVFPAPSPAPSMGQRLAGASSSPTSLAGGEKARDIIRELRARKKIDLDDVFRRAEKFKEQGMLVDAQFMYFFAARRGHADSAIVLGAMYDPEHAKGPIGMIEETDWNQAHKWYLRAVEGGNLTAREPLKRLRKQVERAAAKGDVEARRLTLQWQ
uniref:Sel1 repeat-containing protein n=1 Tax=Candidatus Kentrum sp. MB TaxID=2138164 RepID=A0A450XMG2_9GAMM|nr:MAG: hypothetical protein BECKMB1821G_GA0114241_106610 [Candidatus Kentron sp. MB]VFK33999.1 MAG: hypothetical protein BECKMB1821I_GA0114274_105814 [Candidatus Kentron sp. MB]VFK76410.1 MAG: hypothetical protein BECKMB1821H_GA0114242_105514 [Candidatus Kentron sp. MB]